jgi:protein SCO1/2
MILASALALTTGVVSAQGPLRPEAGMPADQKPTVLAKVAFEQRLNEPLPLDLRFKDEAGRDVRLGDYFGERPVVLAFVYYECPMLCTQVLNGLTGVLKLIDSTVGKEFDVVTVSFDPRETSVLAAAKKKVYLDDYKRPEAERGWHFLTGAEASIAELTKAAGFSYVWDDSTKQFAHASGIVVATPEGKLSRYFFGIDYAARDLQFALIESSAGKIGSLTEKLLLYCYHYDPKSGAYGFVAMQAVRIGGVVTLAALAAFMIVSIRRDTRTTQTP